MEYHYYSKKELKNFTPEIIKGWILDERFEKVRDVPTREEYKQYLENGYITQELYDECMELFDVREKKKQEKEKVSLETREKLYNS